ncbi:hypothetical protein BD311DRAFT_828299 [Dichomitus squalens]|uniref:Uncharacterized protein n=1 Tax=Dichomitus squalens TaxID=114155 RepID=A0A4Q9N338_9APHY|nr:hypothetical protein BD311DRAFT_828299 [Dichomitus squalens]
MDELVRHCLREISFDGDLGCDVSRLRDFVSEFYSHPSSSRVQGQNVDDAFCAFVWSVIVQQPGIRVGTTPEGSSTEVYIAPQVRAIKKAKAKGEDTTAAEDPPPATGLDIIEDATIRPLEDLRQQYGDKLRVAVDPETTFVALTGSHTRPSKLTPMIYTGLQIITRGREHGVSALDLGKKSGYDQKTCFYIIKQLVDLDLVVKLRQPGISTNIVVHKYFYERSPIWQQVVSEEKKAVSEAQAKEDGDSEEEDDGDETKPLEPVHFDPIDSRHLSSMPLLKSRLTKLLKACPHYMHTSNNLMLKIGFVNPTRTERRFFRTRIRELVDEGFIEKVHVPHADRRRFPDKKVPCIRLVTDDAASQARGETVPVEDDELEDIEMSQVEDYTGLKANASLHKQMIDRLAEAGTTGMTLNELSATLGDFDRRTVDLLLNRLEKDPPPAHLADLGIAQLAETHGRERRYKYYTVAHYLALAEKERFEDRRYRDVDMSAVGGFMPIEVEAFYEDEEELDRHVRLMSSTKSGSASLSKAKGKKRTNPILADGSVKKGRPRKSQVVGEDEEAVPTLSKKGKKRKREESLDGGAVREGDAAKGGEPPMKKRRGRPPKNPAASIATDGGLSEVAPIPKKRGRPPKKAAKVDEPTGIMAGPSSEVQEGAVAAAKAPKKRGRPRKTREPTVDATPPDLVIAPAPANDDDIPPISAPVKDVPMLEDPSSSPLPSLSNSPTPAISSARAVTSHTEDVAQPDPPSIVEDSQGAPEAVAISQVAPEVAASTGVRRSTRTPKARKQDDALSPLKKSIRRRPLSTTVPAAAEEPSAPLPTIDIVEAVTQEEPSDKPSLDVITAGEGPRPTDPIPADSTTTDIPIDPALLGDDELSRMAQGHSLIAMVCAHVSEPSQTPAPEFPEAGPSTGTSVPHKRDQPDTVSEGPSTKRTKSGDSAKLRTKGNISQPRRENEILRLLAEADGIINTSSKELYEAHAALVERLVAAGEPVSTRVGARIDKRTLEATLRELESKGKIKLLTTSAPTLTGSTRMARIAYLPEIPPDAVNTFLAELSQQLWSLSHNPSTSTAKTLEEPMDYGGIRKKTSGRVRPSIATEQEDGEVQEIKPTDLGALFQQDDQIIHDTLLTEKHTVAQLYGYLVGKAARARSLHLATVGLFGQDASSTQIVSKEHRIVHISYYFTDIPISTYCSLVAVLQPNEELATLLRSPAGQATPVGGVSDSLRSVLAPTQSKPRARILSLLDLLQVLGLVTPLIPSESDTPAFSCTGNVHHPAAFDVAPPDTYTPAIAPLYWRFNDSAPIRLWAIGEGVPAVWKMAPVSTSQQAALYWNDLQQVCTDPLHAQHLLGPAPASTGPASQEVATTCKSLRRTISWSAVYNLSFYQTEYLRRYIDPATGNTPLEDEDGARRDAQLDRISWIVSASREVVASWFEKARKKQLRDIKKVKLASTKGKQKAATAEDAGVVVARRAAEAKEQRELAWEAMVQRVHPGELRHSAAQRVNRVRSKFIQSSAKPSDKWEARILEAIKEADLVADKLLSTAHPPLFAPMPVAKPALPAPVPTGLQEKDVDELIASQGARAAQGARTGKKTKKGKAKDTGETEVKVPRRHRFLWTRDYDELVRDASAIIKARCRGTTRLDWGAMEQIFPAVPRNSVRQRLVHLKEVPGTETYLSRLEDKWYDLWVQHRGTDVLPDPDPESATNFDLATHVKFLRKHIDKNAIRVGFVEVQDSQKVDLPATIEDIKRHYDIVEKVPSAPTWDFMWSVVAEEAREKQFAHQAFTAEVGGMPPSPSYESEFLYVADTAVKMALGNPNETYDADVASRLLKGVGEEPVRATTTELLNRGVLAKTTRDPTKTKPGRTLKISDSNYNSLGGQLHRELFQDASALEELIVQQQQGDGLNAPHEQGQEWSLLATDGDTAFLLELTSENKVRFDVDTTHPQKMRSNIDWNSKKADDDDIETAIRVQYLDVSGPSRDALSEPSAEPSGIEVEAEMDMDDEHSLREHGTLADGEQAFCRRTSEGLIDCQACLEQARKSLFRGLNTDEQATVDKIIAALDEAGPTGLTKQELLAKLEFVRGDTLHTVVQRMTEGPVPLAHWTGYNAVVLVSSAAIRKWTVIVNDNATEEPEQPSMSEAPVLKSMIFPRRWLDIYGRKLHDVWESALRAVLGLVLLHPGISQVRCHAHLHLHLHLLPRLRAVPML